jgi:hypothetical protein
MDHEIEEVGVEPEGVPATGILAMFGAIVLALTVVVIGGVQIGYAEFASAEVAATETTGYPKLREAQVAGRALLTKTEVVDAANDIYRIPIERAMQLVILESGSGSTSEITLNR